MLSILHQPRSQSESSRNQVLRSMHCDERRERNAVCRYLSRNRPASQNDFGCVDWFQYPSGPLADPRLQDVHSE